ncbi:hypothetical protein AB4Z42_19005 [Mycobacterium sp. 2YAF39]|uniref:hypothetical protein n=1 Tax=Mycobacterium sp. 2YAF39 TaxID=3233033 RepID=UPI003F94E055
MQRPSSPIYRVTRRLGPGLTVEVPADAIATTVSAWLAELGADSPLADDLEKAVHAGNWSAARTIGEYLAVDVTAVR